MTQTTSSSLRAFTTADRRILFLASIVGFVAGYAGSQMPHTLPFARTALELTEGQMSGIFAAVGVPATEGAKTWEGVSRKAWKKK